MTMLKKPNVLLPSYSNLHTLCCPQSYSVNAATTNHHPREPLSIGGRKFHWRCYATARSGSFQDQRDDFPWPKLPSATAIPTPYQILRIRKGDPYSKQRYYELVKLYHPDRHTHGIGHLNTSSLTGASKMERYRLVVSAHEILSDPTRRSAYDATGAGWNGRPEHGAPKYYWSQNNENRWSGFDTNDSPFRNATWEDWEKWYMRDKVKQEPVYFSNGGFLMLVIAVVFLGGFGQSIRVGDYSNIFRRQVEMVHGDASKVLRRRKTQSTGFGNKDERLQSFLKSRDPHGYGVTDPTEEGYRKLLPEPEGADRILIDTGEGKPSWSRHLSSVLASEDASISHALITHWHPDHVGGIEDLTSLCPDVSIHKCTIPDRPDPAIKNSIVHRQVFEVNGATLHAFHCPGHTSDHMSFILREEDAMFTGDNVLGHGTAVFDDLAVYVDSLSRMREQFKGRAYPGHGAVIENGPAKIDEYISHRQQREQEILRALNGVDRVATPMELAKVVYKDVPENLHGPAAGGVVQVLQKLEGDGKVARTGNDKWQMAEKAAL